MEVVTKLLKSINSKLVELNLIAFDYSDVHDCEYTIDINVFLESILHVSKYVPFRLTLGNFKISETKTLQMLLESTTHMHIFELKGCHITILEDFEVETKELCKILVMAYCHLRDGKVDEASKFSL